MLNHSDILQNVHKVMPNKLGAIIIICVYIVKLLHVEEITKFWQEETVANLANNHANLNHSNFIVQTYLYTNLEVQLANYTYLTD